MVDSAMTRIKEYPHLIIDFFFSKTRGDCIRIQGGEDEIRRQVDDDHYEQDDVPLPSDADLILEFGVPHPDEGYII